MSAARLKAGDVVCLKAPGSPAMTLTRFEDGPVPFEQPGWEAVWFIQGALRRATFPADALKRYRPPPCDPPAIGATALPVRRRKPPGGLAGPGNPSGPAAPLDPPTASPGSEAA